jgi:hypothetical protein
MLLRFICHAESPATSEKSNIDYRGDERIASRQGKRRSTHCRRTLALRKRFQAELCGVSNPDDLIRERSVK